MLSPNIVETLYPPEGIFIRSHEFDDDSRSIHMVCMVPKGTSYTIKPIPYVTAENYVRCMSQASYLLAEHMLEKHLLPLEVTVESFQEVAAKYELYYRNLSLIFHKLVEQGEEFEMRLTLKNWREIRRLQDFILFTFTNQRIVISGEMSFVFAGS